MIEFHGVSKTYSGGTEALTNIDLNIEKGEFVFILGHSGAGKSTLFKLIMREETATEGRVIVGDYDLSRIKRSEIPYLRRQIGVVFQDFRLIPNLTAYENVAFAMRVTNIPTKEIRKRVPYILSLVGLAEKSRMRPHQLSGGEQQRVALARALVHNPPIIIADEPTGNIDPALSFEIMELLSEINRLGTTILVVTHEHELVECFKKRIIELRGGRIVSDTGKGARG